MSINNQHGGNWWDSTRKPKLFQERKKNVEHCTGSRALLRNKAIDLLHSGQALVMDDLFHRFFGATSGALSDPGCILALRGIPSGGHPTLAAGTGSGPCNAG